MNLIKKIHVLAFLLCITIITTTSIKAMVSPPPPTVASYDTTLLYHTMAKARNGENIVIGVIGGSITAGNLATADNKRWANLVQDWWEAKFPGITVSLVNAGIGGTGSDVGTHRIRTDLLSKSPDFVIVEFSVNDTEGEMAEKMMEGIVRQVLADTNHPSLMLLMLKQESGATAQASHKPVGSYYEIPMVSVADMIDAKVVADGKTLHDVYADGIHPNDLGMQYIANFIKAELDSVYKRLPDDSQIPAIDPVLPAPRLTDTYQFTYKYGNSNLVPTTTSGWEKSGLGWVSSVPGSEITFDVDGNAISIQYSRHNSTNRGRVEIWIDNGTHQILDAYWNQTWGPATVFCLVQEGLADGMHTLHLKVLEEHDPASSGNYFALLNVLKAGNIQSAAPIAIPLEQKKILTGTNVQLDGSTSYDPDGDELVSYLWTVDVAPASSTASLTNSSNASASFTPDVAGYYKIGLTVNDGALNSVKQKVTLHAVATNAKPVADAGSDVFVATNKYAYLKGTNSSDADNDTMTFKWSVLSQPAGSSEQVINDDTPEPYFRPRQEGEFLIGLVVNDSIENSDVDTIKITAIDNYTSMKLNTMQDFKIYPNPSSGKFTMDYDLENAGNVLIAVYSLDGKKLTTLVDEIQGQGNHQLKCDLNSFTAKGNYYILEFRVNDQVRTESFLVK